MVKKYRLYSLPERFRLFWGVIFGAFWCFFNEIFAKIGFTRKLSRLSIVIINQWVFSER